MRILMFHREAKMYENRQKQTKKNYSVNPPYIVGPVRSNCTRLRYETNTIRYLKQIISLPISKHKSIDFLSKILTFGKVRIAQPRSHWANSIFNQ